jgi:hypothetical protein
MGAMPTALRGHASFPNAGSNGSTVARSSIAIVVKSSACTGLRLREQAGDDLRTIGVYCHHTPFDAASGARLARFSHVAQGGGKLELMRADKGIVLIGLLGEVVTFTYSRHSPHLAARLTRPVSVE